MSKEKFRDYFLKLVIEALEELGFKKSDMELIWNSDHLKISRKKTVMTK
jgi:hypothetical protein